LLSLKNLPGGVVEANEFKCKEPFHKQCGPWIESRIVGETTSLQMCGEGLMFTKVQAISSGWVFLEQDPGRGIWCSREHGRGGLPT
jgi:hypothetical protein